MSKKIYFRFHFSQGKNIIYQYLLLINFELVSCLPSAVLIDFKKVFVPSPEDELFNLFLNNLKA